MYSSVTQRFIYLILVSTLFLLLCCFANANSVGWDKADESWLKQSSKHFTVIYLSQFQDDAERVLKIAETVHQQLFPFYKVTPKNKIRIILSDDTDTLTNIEETLEYGEIRLAMTPPTDIAEIEAEDDWYHLYLMNEYSQILHFELASGTFRGMLLAAEFTPSVLYKGVALYLQNNNDLNSNLLNVSTSEMKMRMEVDAKQLRELNKIVIETKEWPYDALYFYGAYFIDYLSKTYGEEKVLAFLQDYSESIFAYLLLNQQTVPYFDKDLYSLWAEFQSYLELKFRAQTDLIGEEISGKKIKNLKYLLPAAPGNNGLLIGLANGEDRHSIHQLTKQGWQTITYVDQVRAFDNHPSQGLLMSRSIAYINQHTFNDIFIFNNNQWRRMSEKQRFKYVRWLNNGKQFIASRIIDGISELWLLSLDQNIPPKKLWRGEDNEIIGDFAVSPDDSYLIASLKRSLQSWKLSRFDLSTLKWQRLTQQKGSETSPSFTAQGNILFSANYNHIYNIYQYDTQNGDISQLTNVIAGAFRPLWQEELGLVFQTYQYNGYSLRHIKAPQPVNNIHYAKERQLNNVAHYSTDIDISEPEQYSAIETIQSHSFYPVLFADEIRALVGINTYGADALGRHNYDFYALWDVVYEQASYMLEYKFDNRWTLSYTQDYNFDNLTPELDQANYQISQTQVYLLQRENILNAWEDNFGLHTGLTYTLDKIVSSPELTNTDTQLFDSDNAAELTLGLGLTFDNREYYLNVPGTGWGHYFDFTFEENILKADFSGKKYQTQWQFTFDLPKRFTLLNRLSAGYADKDAKPFAVGGNHLSEEMRLFDRTQQSIRGYDDLSQLGHIYLTQRIELNAFLGRYQQNFGLFPLGMGDIAGKIYMDSGSAWDEGDSAEPLVSFGAQIQIEFKLGYNYQLPISFGYAQGLDQSLGKSYLYMNFGNSY